MESKEQANRSEIDAGSVRRLKKRAAYDAAFFLCLAFLLATLLGSLWVKVKPHVDFIAQYNGSKAQLIEKNGGNAETFVEAFAKDKALQRKLDFEMESARSEDLKSRKAWHQTPLYPLWSFCSYMCAFRSPEDVMELKQLLPGLIEIVVLVGIGLNYASKTWRISKPCSSIDTEMSKARRRVVLVSIIAAGVQGPVSRALGARSSVLWALAALFGAMAPLAWFDAMAAATILFVANVVLLAFLLWGAVSSGGENIPWNQVGLQAGLTLVTYVSLLSGLQWRRMRRLPFP